MAGKGATIDSMAALFDGSARPIYAIDDNSQIVYCNRALSEWMGLEPKRIVGRIVEFHSESEIDRKAHPEAPLTDLCPPPCAIAGEGCTGTISCLAADGRLAHRHAQFSPLGRARAKSQLRTRNSGVARFPVLVMLAEEDMSVQDVSAELSDEPTSDELHRTIRRFRRAHARSYSMVSVLGNSLPVQKVRSQIAAAVASGANTLICGRPGSGRGHVARAIHYAAPGDEAKLFPIDCRLLTDDLFRRVMESASVGPLHDDLRVTLLFENIEEMSATHQSLLVRSVGENALTARIIATSSDHGPFNARQDEQETNDRVVNGEAGEETSAIRAELNSELSTFISTITIHMPRLVDRMEDLPILSQYFLEACNQGSVKQIGSIRGEALDMLALYNWPGELDQLRDVISSAHQNCKTHEITSPDLPPIVHHASEAATHLRPQPERIVLDELLASIEMEVIIQALRQANGNKSEAASLLGISRPRLYRKLVQFGMVQETDETSDELPEFIERDATE